MHRDLRERLVAVAVLLATLSLGRSARAEAPEDGWIVWASTRANGRTELFRGRANGTEVTQLTQNGGTFPSWSPDGRWITYFDDVGGVFLMHPDGSGTKKLPFPNPPGAPAFWLHDNSGLVASEADAVYLYDPDTLEKKELWKQSDFKHRGQLFHFYAMTHDNRYVLVGTDVFLNGFTAENGTFMLGYSAVAIDLLDKKKMYLMGAGCWPFTPPAGDLLYHIRGDNPSWPDIYRINVADLATRRSYEAEVAHPDEDWGHEYHPRISSDNKWVAYMTSNGCHWDLNCNNEIFIHRLGTGSTERIRVTDHESFDGFPAMWVGPLWKKSTEPTLLTAPRQVTFFARGGAMPAAQTIKLKNLAGGTFSAAQTVVEPTVPWLDVATGPAGVTIGLRKGHVRRGQHRADVVLTVADAQNGRATIPISLDADDSFPPVPPPDAGAPDAGVVTAAKTSSKGCAIAPLGGADASGLPALAALLLLALRRVRARR